MGIKQQPPPQPQQPEQRRCPRPDNLGIWSGPTAVPAIPQGESTLWIAPRFFWGQREQL